MTEYSEYLISWKTWYLSIMCCPRILHLKGRVITEDLLLKEITGMLGSDLTKKQD